MGDGGCAVCETEGEVATLGETTPLLDTEMEARGDVDGIGDFVDDSDVDDVRDMLWEAYDGGGGGMIAVLASMEEEGLGDDDGESKNQYNP